MPRYRALREFYSYLGQHKPGDIIESTGELPPSFRDLVVRVDRPVPESVKAAGGDPLAAYEIGASQRYQDKQLRSDEGLPSAGSTPWADPKSEPAVTPKAGTAPAEDDEPDEAPAESTKRRGRT